MRDLIAAAAGDVSECSTRGAGRAARLLGLAYLGAWTSYYLAVGAGHRPLADPRARRDEAPPASHLAALGDSCYSCDVCIA